MNIFNIRSINPNKLYLFDETSIGTINRFVLQSHDFWTTTNIAKLTYGKDTTALHLEKQIQSLEENIKQSTGNFENYDLILERNGWNFIELLFVVYHLSYHSII